MTAAPMRTDGKLTVALVSEVFWEPDGEARLEDRLREAVERGADLAVLPELPLNPWSPATKVASDDDAEPMDGPRAQAPEQRGHARGIGLVGGIIHRDETGRRTSRALVFDRAGALRATYEKLHLPDEEGFWGPSHYEPGTEPRRIDVVRRADRRQLCSDNNRPEGTHLLGAQGVAAMLNPRASEERTYQRWKTVWRANALTSCCYVLSVNRPHPEQGVLIGGPSVAIDPGGGGAGRDDGHHRGGHARRGRRGRCASRLPRPPRGARLYADAWAEIATADGDARDAWVVSPRPGGRRPFRHQLLADVDPPTELAGPQSWMKPAALPRL